MLHPDRMRENRGKLKKKWITREAYPGTNYPFYNCTCSECRHTVPMVLEEWKGRCPKCGTKLEE